MRFILGGVMSKRIERLLCTGLVLLVFAACGGGKKAASGGSAAAFNETGFPIVNEPLTLRVIAAKSSVTKDYNELPVFQELEKKTGIHINWEYTGPDWSTNKPLVLASGDLPDLFLGRTALEEPDVINNMSMFLELDPLIEKYGTNVKAMFQVDSAMERFAKAYNGKIYGLPMKMPRRPETYTIWSINQDWLDKLGLNTPTTTEEFYTVLKAFKTRDPNGNGIADEIPWSFLSFDDNPGCMEIFGAFGVVESMNDSWLTVTNGKVEHITVQEGFRDAVIYLRRLYAEGLIDQESFSDDWATHFAKTSRPSDLPEIVGVSGTWMRDYNWGKERMPHYPVLLPLKGPKGHQAWRRNTEFVQAAKYAAEIPASTKNPEIIMRWLDTLYEPLIGLQLYYGAVGVVVMDNGDGTYDIPLPPAGGGGSNDDWLWTNALGDLAPGYGDGMTKYIRDDALFGEQYNDKLRYAPFYPKEFFPLAAQTPEEADELSLLRTDIHGFAQQQAATWIVNGGIEQEYAGFIQQLKNMGMDRMVEVYQSIYNRYMGK
jgi:putative aldouronate transport system substrate-binding protein